MIMFLSDNGWLQGEHRIPGDKFLPYEESLRVPLILRGPGRARRARRSRARSRTSTSPRPCSTPPTRRPGARWTGSRCCRPIAQPERRPEPRARDRGARAAVRGPDPGQRLGPALHGRAHRPLHLRRLDRDRRGGALRPPDATRTSSPNLADDPAYAAIKARPGRRSSRSSTDCAGALVQGRRLDGATAAPRAAEPPARHHRPAAPRRATGPTSPAGSRS